MDIFSGIVLGAIQGLTEFLPISSSGHLILAREILGLQTGNGLAVDAILQLATILAVGIYFHKDLISLPKTAIFVILKKPIDKKNKTLLIAIILGTIPALIAGLLLEKTMGTVFRSAELVAITLILGSVLFWLAEKNAKQNKPLDINKGFLIGLFQTLALVPGVSRSGSTISGGLILGLTREQAARYSFLLSFPIILGSGLKKLLDLRNEQTADILNLPLLLAFITAFIVGLLCIHFLLRYLKNHSLNIFIIYRLALATSVLYFVIFNSLPPFPLPHEKHRGVQRIGHKFFDDFFHPGALGTFDQKNITGIISSSKISRVFRSFKAENFILAHSGITRRASRIL